MKELKERIQRLAIQNEVALTDNDIDLIAINMEGMLEPTTMLGNMPNCPSPWDLFNEKERDDSVWEFILDYEEYYNEYNGI